MLAQPLGARALAVGERRRRKRGQRAVLAESLVDRREVLRDELGVAAEEARFLHQDGSDAQGAARGEVLA